MLFIYLSAISEFHTIIYSIPFEKSFNPRGLSLFCHQDLETVYCLTFFYMTKIDMRPICIHRAKYPIVVSRIIDK